MVNERLDEIDPREVNSIPIGTDAEGREIVVRVGQYGPYLSRDGETAPVPDGLAPDELTVEKAEELLATPSGDRVLGNDPDTGLPVIARAGRFGPYVQLGEADSSAKTKPHTASLLQEDEPRHAHPRRRPAAAHPAPGAGQRPHRRPRRSASRTAATGRT